MTTHHASLMMSDFLACNSDFNYFLVVVAPDFILSRLSWTDPVRTVHLFDIM